MKFPKLRNSRPVQGYIDVETTSRINRNEKSRKKDARCLVCGNIYREKRWYRPGEASVPPNSQLLSTTCPGCVCVQDGRYAGELKLSGSFLQEHGEEITNLIQNTVHQVQEKNPLAKLVQDPEDEDGITLRTTTAKLAERLGQKLKKSYRGELDKTSSDSSVRIRWHRDE